MPSNVRLILFLPIALLPISLSANGLQTPELSFERDVRPILKKHCFQCHGEGEKLKGGLDLRLRRFMIQPNEDGDVAVVPGKANESEMIKLVRDGDMPKKGERLPPAEIAVLERWVQQGAKTLRPEPEKVPRFFITEEERDFWAFQPLKKVEPPAVKDGSRVQNPIDAFVEAKLEEKGLTFAPEADKRTLIRRVAIDLTGLPPTPAELDLFLADDAPDAYARMVERYLASPHYGERWGRHWLDVAGYADSDGYSDADPVRPWAYKYRDYVIRSINADKPFDQFICEQIAGDEMVKQPYKDLKPADVDKLTATGFLRMVPDGTGGADAASQTTARNAVVAETIKVVSSSLLGITVGCAQCHDHRLDPVPQTDYYRMRAIFEPALSTANWRMPNARLISLLSEKDRAKAAEIEAEAKVIDDARLKKADGFITDVLERELAAKPEAIREPLRQAFRTELKKRTPEQVKLLKEHPTVNQLSHGSLYLYDRTYGTHNAEELKKLADQAAEVRKRKPVEEFVPALTEPVVSATPPPTFLFNRGDPGQPRDKVGPGELTILASFRQTEIPEKDKSLPTTGRRLAFARSLTDGANPLTNRVLVNRIWHHHFGRGIVASLGDFGHIGDRPSHPELLDWLAGEFPAEGWSLKKLNRLILNSATYRQSSAHEPAKDRLDPDNRLLGRMNVRRLEAETIRDAMLVSADRLNPKMFGAPVPIMSDEEGQIVVGVDTTDTAGRPSGKFIPLNGEEFRRSLYIQVRRSKPLGLLETFDMPRMAPNCEFRNASTVAPQSLAMMNGEFTLAQAQHFAERLTKEAGAALEAQVKLAWKIAFASEPNATELSESLAFLKKQTAHFKADPIKPIPAAPGKEPPPADAPTDALATFCQALLTSNQFLYVD